MGISREKFKTFLYWYTIFVALFHFYQNLFGEMSNLWFNTAHFALLASVGFLTFKPFKSSSEESIGISNIIFALLSLGVLAYMMFFEESL